MCNTTITNNLDLRRVTPVELARPEDGILSKKGNYDLFLKRSRSSRDGYKACVLLLNPLPTTVTTTTTNDSSDGSSSGRGSNSNTAATARTTTIAALVVAVAVSLSVK